MCDAVRLSIYEFTDLQIEKHNLNDYVTLDDDVIFKFKAKPNLIPFNYHGRVELTHWAGYYSESRLLNGMIHALEPKPVEIPALRGFQNGIWFPVAPLHIRGVIVPRTRESSQIYVLTRPSCPFYLEMTKCEIEPVYTGNNLYANPLTWERD